MKHYLITEWNVDMLDMEWLTSRQKLFEKFTLPSVMAQNTDEFEWILVSDARTPDEFKRVLDSYPATVFYFDFDGFDWESPEWAGSGTKSAIMQRSIDLEYIAKPLRKFIGEQTMSSRHGWTMMTLLPRITSPRSSGMPPTTGA